MFWNYRVIQEKNYFSIREVYYDDNEEPKMVSADPISPIGESLEILKKDLELMLGALSKPILDINIFNKCNAGKNTQGSI